MIPYRMSENATCERKNVGRVEVEPEDEHHEGDGGEEQPVQTHFFDGQKPSQEEDEKKAQG